VIPVQPVVEKVPRTQEAALQEKEEPKASPAPVQSAVSFYVSASPAPTPTPVVRKAPPKIWLPPGIFIPCALVNTVDSSHMDTPVVGEVIRDVWQRNNGTSHLIIPAGTLVNCFASAGRVRDRVEVKGTWSLTFPDGLEYELEGVACDREADPETQEHGLEDGSAGLQGNIYYTDRYAELKAFGAAVLTGVMQGFQTVQGTSYNGNNLEHTPQNAMLQGATSVADLLVLKYLNANLPAKKQASALTTGPKAVFYPPTYQPPHNDQRVRDAMAAADQARLAAEQAQRNFESATEDIHKKLQEDNQLKDEIQELLKQNQQLRERLEGGHANPSPTATPSKSDAPQDQLKNWGSRLIQYSGTTATGTPSP